MNVIQIDTLKTTYWKKTIKEILVQKLYSLKPLNIVVEKKKKYSKWIYQVRLT